MASSSVVQFRINDRVIVNKSLGNYMSCVSRQRVNQFDLPTSRASFWRIYYTMLARRSFLNAFSSRVVREQALLGFCKLCSISLYAVQILEKKDCLASLVVCEWLVDREKVEEGKEDITLLDVFIIADDNNNVNEECPGIQRERGVYLLSLVLVKEFLHGERSKER